MAPRTVSAGQVAHQPTTATSLPVHGAAARHDGRDSGRDEDSAKTNAKPRSPATDTHAGHVTARPRARQTCEGTPHSERTSRSWDFSCSTSGKGAGGGAEPR